MIQSSTRLDSVGTLPVRRCINNTGPRRSLGAFAFGVIVVMAAGDSDEAAVTTSLWVDPGIPRIGPLVCDRSAAEP